MGLVIKLRACRPLSRRRVLEGVVRAAGAGQWQAVGLRCRSLSIVGLTQILYSSINTIQFIKLLAATLAGNSNSGATATIVVRQNEEIGLDHMALAISLRAIRVLLLQG